MNYLLIFLFLSLNAFAETSTCFVTMKDTLNNHTAILSANEVSKDKFIVKDYTQFYNGEPNTVIVKVKNGYVYPINASTPHGFTLYKLVNDWKMVDDTQLTFSKKSKSCSDEVLTSLIYFLVMEWFYFG